MERYWLGIDAGTTAIKCGVYRRDGSLVASADVPSRVTTPADGHSEQDMQEVWQSVQACLRMVTSQVAADQIESIGIAAQGDGFWALDADNMPVGPAILWNDTRAAADVDAAYESGAATAISHACHTSIWPGTSGAIYSWLQREDPARANRVARIVYCAGWVGYCLTGVLATDYSDSTIPFYDLHAGDYSDAALGALDAQGLRQAFLPPQPAARLLGHLSAEAAAATGLPAGLPVSTGTLDLSAMIVGLGLDSPGDTMMIMGTTAVVNILTDKITPTDLPVGATVLHANGELFTRVLAPTTGAAAFDWFCALHPGSLGGDTPGEIAEKLNALAVDVPPGANGVLFLPHLNGERAPFVAANARGAFFGLSARSTKADMGRAVMEGAAMSLRHCFHAEYGGRPQGTVHLTGGGARNGLWCQIIADIMGATIEVSDATDHGLWGAACLGASANGEGDACALAKRDEATTQYHPTPEAVRAYDAVFEQYLVLSEACRNIWKS
ncbi:FGGY-family carbohydrate kinase [uncultured Tateyamaria sp.]|uniref:xylulokinase n=1 Tax=uncultured Tateyamaria sp. TaxID=455651 RepID=UPI00262EE872|nr:FGGY-family carbohydrate kinase [uncultured Tateyamaria sp.]